jgi:hypothetical protein
MPTADDLFRPTSGEDSDDAGPGKPVVSAVPARAQEESEQPRKRNRRSSGRVRHDEKMTVYVTAEELLDLEHARLALRRDHGIAVDRGRMVREALAIVLADLEHNGGDSDLVHRLEA